MKMKVFDLKLPIIFSFSIFLLAGCSSTKTGNPQISGYSGLQKMSQEEVIVRTERCHDAGMRAVVNYVQQEFSGQTVDIPVGVNCYPRN